jgi:hypothetical protein
MIFLKNPQFWFLNLITFFVETWLRSSVVHSNAPACNSRPPPFFFPLLSLMGGVVRHYSNKDNQTVAGVEKKYRGKGKRGT